MVIHSSLFPPIPLFHLFLRHANKLKYAYKEILAYCWKQRLFCNMGKREYLIMFSLILITFGYYSQE